MKATRPTTPRRPGRTAFAALLSGLVALGLPTPAFAEDAKPAQNAPAGSAKSEAAAAAKETTDANPGAADAAKDEEKKKEDAKPGEAAAEETPADFRNWFDVSVGGLVVNGNEAAAQRRLGLPASAFGGVSGFHFEQDVGKKGLFKVDGRGIFDNEDYGVRLEWSDPDKGFVRGGFDQYREYYDGSGGWFPQNGQWFDLYDDDMHVLRGTAYFEAGLRLPKIPEITVSYSHDWREGTKDSTIWGDTGLTGGVGPRAIVPTFLELDEKTDTITLDVRHTLGKVTFGGAFTYEHTDIDDGRYMRRMPYESSDRHVTQRERVETDVYNARAFVDTTFNPKLRLTTAYAFTTLETDLGGTRIVGADYDAVYDPVYGRRDVGFLGLTGGTQIDQNVWNANVLWNPIPNLAVIPAVRVEDQSLKGSSSWADTGAESIDREAANRRDMLDLSQQLELRYTGVTNVVFYARGDWVQGDGNLLESQTMLKTGTTELYRDSDFDRFSQKYSAGAHWYPLKRVNLHAQYYRKMRDNQYDNDPAQYINYSGAYPAFITAQDFTTDDVNFRVTWRPLDKLTLVTRYDFQLNSTEMEGTGVGSQQSGEGTAHILGETLTWTPFNRLYIQPGVNYVLDEMTSEASTQVPGGSPVEDSHNDYFNVTCTVGFALDDKTDLQAQYSYYLADNFEDISAWSQPYGAGTEEHGILASVIRRISPRLRVTLRYGFFTSHDELSGGYNDYDSHLIYSSAQYLF